MSDKWLGKPICLVNKGDSLNCEMVSQVGWGGNPQRAFYPFRGYVLLSAIFGQQNRLTMIEMTLDFTS